MRKTWRNRTSKEIGDMPLADRAFTGLRPIRMPTTMHVGDSKTKI